MATNNTTPLEYTHEVNFLVKQAFIFENVAGHPHTPMIQLVDELLKRNESSLNATFGKYLILPNHTVHSVLEELSHTLHRLPHDSIKSEQQIISSVLLGVTVLAVALRFWARKYITPKQIRTEDWWCLASLTIVTVLTICLWLLNYKGAAGEHIWDISFSQYRLCQLWLWICQMSFYPAHAIVKIAFLVFYRRLFVSRGYRIAIWGVGIFTVSTCVVGLFGAIFQCKPIDFWNHFLTKKCIDLGKFYLIRSTLYSLTDFMILVLPIPGILKLRIKVAEKILLIGLFGMGIFISITSVFRLMALWEWFSSMDFPYRVDVHNIWACVELDLAIIIMCAPALKVLFFHQNSPFPSIPSVVYRNWSTRGGTFHPNRSSAINTWRRNKERGSGKSATSSTKKSMTVSDGTTATLWTLEEEGKIGGSKSVVVTSQQANGNPDEISRDADVEKAEVGR